MLASDNSRLDAFVAGTVAVGFSETMSSMQKYAKRLHGQDSLGFAPSSDRKLKHQYASVMLGVAFAFTVGGFVYEYRGIDGVCIFGVCIQALSLVALGAFVLCLSKDKTTTDVPGEVNETTRASRGDSRNNSVLTTAVNDAVPRFNASDKIGTNWLVWVMAISFGVESLTIGYNLSIGPIFLLDEFNRGTGIIGVMFAVGALSGTVAAIGATCTDVGEKFLKGIAKSPFDICFAMGGIAVGVLLAAAPSFPVYVLGVILLMAFNDLAATLMTEFQASINTTANYFFISPMGQVVRRSINVITALTGPILFGYSPRLPYIIAGAVTLVWTLGLIILFDKRLDSIVPNISRETGRSENVIRAKMERGSILFSSLERLYNVMRVSQPREHTSDEADEG